MSDVIQFNNDKKTTSDTPQPHNYRIRYDSNGETRETDVYGILSLDPLFVAVMADETSILFLTPSGNLVSAERLDDRGPLSGTA